MEQKKSQRADLERWRPALFLVGLVVSLSLFFAALGYRTSDDSDIDVSSLLDDVSKENEYVPAYVPDRTNMVAAAAAKPKKPDTQQLKVVDHKTPAEQLGDIAKSHTEGEDGDEAADASTHCCRYGRQSAQLPYRRAVARVSGWYVGIRQVDYRQLEVSLLGTKPEDKGTGGHYVHSQS